jgi:hypothetical protein
MKQNFYVNFCELFPCLTGLGEPTENLPLLEQVLNILRLQVGNVTARNSYDYLEISFMYFVKIKLTIRIF